MIEKLEIIKKEAIEEITNVTDEVTLNNVKSKYIGKKSVFNEIMSLMGSLSIEEKRHTRLEGLLKDIIDNPNKVSDNASAFEEILLENEEIDSLSPYDFMEE